MRLFARRSKNFTVPQRPCHFLYKRQDRWVSRRARPGPSMEERKDFCPEKSLPLPLKEGRSLDHVTGGHRPTGFLSPGRVCTTPHGKVGNKSRTDPGTLARH